MKKGLILLIFLTGCLGYHQSSTKLSTVTTTDRNGFQETVSATDRLEKYDNVDFLTPQPYETVMRIYRRDSQGNIPAILTSYHQNGQPKQYLEVINGRARGCYMEWHANGTLALETKVVEGEAAFDQPSQETWVFDSVSLVFDENGNKLAEIPYEKGRLEGTAFYYHPCGSLWKKISYCKGCPSGIAAIYLEDGSLLQQAEYAEGKRQGKTVRYWNPGQMAAEENYEKGLLLSANYFSESGKPIAEIRFGEGFKAVFGKNRITELQEYKEGFPEGLVQVLATDGSVEKLYHIKDGVKDGEDIEFYPDSGGQIPKISTPWVEGEIHGIVKTWYANGILESQREVQGDKKQGVLTAWYKDGSLMMVEDYDKDQLIRGQYFKKGEGRPVSTVEGGEGLATLYDGSGNFKAKAKYKNGKPVL